MPWFGRRTLFTNVRVFDFNAGMTRIFVVLAILCAAGLVRAGTLAQFRTPLGDIEVELLDQDKPITVQNFVRYIESGAYADMFFHRWVPGFVIQGGGVMVTNRTTDPEFSFVPNFGPITNEFDVGAIVSNTYGTLAMAKIGGDPHSASSQWFFNLGDNSANLDTQNGGFTVFGRVIGGTELLNRFNSTSPDNGIFLANVGVSPLTELPVLSASPTFNDLVYADISLLQVRVENANGQRLISWNSVSNRLHHVEFTTTLPPDWQTLVSTNGNGVRMEVTDDSSRGATRFYRVRVEYQGLE
jgi:cyclophilin family peptidyl-prolyl cis-trans isomerase